MRSLIDEEQSSEMMTKNYRIFVEKRENFRVEAQSLKAELNTNLNLKIEEIRVINVYDLFGFSEELLKRAQYGVFAEVVTDTVTHEMPHTKGQIIAIENLPGQFDQRAASAVDCVKLLEPTAQVTIKSAKVLVIESHIEKADIERIKRYCINTVECREKNMQVLSNTETATPTEVQTLPEIRTMEPQEMQEYCKKMGLAMSPEDLREVQKYFNQEQRDPSETELRILDTYWSDHCRHTTFTSEITEIAIAESFIKAEIEAQIDGVLKIREQLGRTQKPLCLMELATIGARYLRKEGLLEDMEISEENNACSIFVDVDVDGGVEKWLLQFKNETHNHPTEIEPFGGASTCLGGAIRDPLSGRAYVYQAMRVTGAGDIYLPLDKTMENKLPQRIISKKAADGYSSYGNQIGLATTHVREIYHPNYVAKRLEVGAVCGAVKADAVRRESPQPGDIVLMFGGRTGRDGVGGATGSSKEHTEESLETCSSEVQKGNAPEERKIARLFRNPKVTRLIKKSNDFGAGGVSVAIGELTDGLDIYLDRILTKYSGLNATEIAISESQERMSVVVEKKDQEEFMQYCKEENLEVTHVADVTDLNRMRMFQAEKIVVDLRRDFIDSAGAPHYAKAEVAEVVEKDVFKRQQPKGKTLQQQMLENMADDNVVSQRGLIEMFDATIGASTVLMPFGGATQRTETQVSLQKLPTEGVTNTASIMAFGYNPYIAEWSPYHGAAYAVIEACAKVVAAGASYHKMRFSYQEYFERMTDEQSWGKPLAALLGALKMQVELKLPAIGGKDSMSGTYKDINVPPMLMAFGVTTMDARSAIAPEIKAPGNKIAIYRHTPLENGVPDTDALKEMWSNITEQIAAGNIISAYAIGFGGVAEAIAKMSFGNEIGAEIQLPQEEIFSYSYGSIIVECSSKKGAEEAIAQSPYAEIIGQTTKDAIISINGAKTSIEELYRANTQKFAEIYPDSAKGAATVAQMPEATDSKQQVAKYSGKQIEKPIAYLPIFPGTNCDYDTAKAYRRAGAEVITSVFCNITSQAISNSIEKMVECIDKCNIFMLSGGFSSGDEPDGSGKFIATVLNNQSVKEAIHRLIEREGLILGICNGFQALVKSGLLPHGRLGMLTENSPTLFRNNINRHISQMVNTRVAGAAAISPWLAGMKQAEMHTIAMSHGEGRFMVAEEMAKELFQNNQVAFQYADLNGEIALETPDNPNGSCYAIEGICSADGRILGKMGHTERYEQGLYANIKGNLHQPLFENAVAYFRNGNK